jgi:hypothetical protein
MATGRVPTTANSPLTAKGDLFTYSTAPARLAVGNNGETIVADSSTSTGLRYTAGNPIPNPVINSCFDIWQRGTSISVAAGSNGYTADRWYTGTGSSQACTVSRQATGDTTNLPNIQYAMRFQRNSGQTGTSPIGLYNPFETTNSILFAGKTVTYSFYARGGATFLSSGATLTAAFTHGTGTDQNPATGYTGGVTPIYSNAALTATWQRFTYTTTVPSTATEITPYFVLTFVGTAGATDFAEITGVQIDIGSVALPIRRNGATIQGELAACQRYYYRLSGATYTSLGNGVMTSATKAQSYVGFPQLMRTSPTINTTGTASNYAVANAVAYTCSSVPVLTGTIFTSPSGCTVEYTSSGMTAASGAYIYINNNADAFLAFSAEL